MISASGLHQEEVLPIPGAGGLIDRIENVIGRRGPAEHT